MTAMAGEVLDFALIERLNKQILARYADLRVFGPGVDSVAVIHLSPEIVSPVGVKGGRSKAQSFCVRTPTVAH